MNKKQEAAGNMISHVVVRILKLKLKLIGDGTMCHQTNVQVVLKQDHQKDTDQS